MLGFITSVTRVVSYEAMKQALFDSIPGGTEELNLKAFEKGYEYGKGLLDQKQITDEAEDSGQDRDHDQGQQDASLWQRCASSYSGSASLSLPCRFCS